MVTTFAPLEVVNQIFDILERPDITHTPITKTIDNVSGDETFVAGTPATISGVLFKRSTNWLFDKEGLVDQGDGYIAVRGTIAVVPKKNDLMTFDGETYRVDRVIDRYGDTSNDTIVFYFCNLFKTS